MTPSLKSREDLQKALLGLLEPLRTRFVPDGLYLGFTGSSYSPRVVRLEGWSRLLWGIAPLLAGGGTYPLLDTHREVLVRCTDPKSPFYWGTPGNKDQRLVEMAPLALALLLAREWFWDPLTISEKENLYRWLSTIQQRELPANNWHFFRILVCTAFRFLELPVEEEAEAESFRIVEGCYQGNGWYIDGTNATYDLYNPTGFHFYGLLYAHFIQQSIQQGSVRGRYLRERADLFLERAQIFTERARLLAPQYLAWFREDGSFIPFGRSLTYRFVAASFFSACAFVGLQSLSWGVLKGAVLRHLRYWFDRPILDSSGTLTIGYGYPNLVMAEQYNSPGSSYWGLKTFLILALPPDHPFWTTPEEPLPSLPDVSCQTPPGFIVSRSREDVQILNPGYYPGWEAVHSAAKYGKFAYSARFGFCVSHGSYGLEKTGCDSSLVLSEGDGYWRERRHTRDVRSGDGWTESIWNPWPDVEVDTLLISLGLWHVRIHRIKTPRPLQAVEGGFSVARYSLSQYTCPSQNTCPQSFLDQEVHPRVNGYSPAELTALSAVPEGKNPSTDPEPSLEYSTNPPGITIHFPWAASRIVDLSPNSSRKGEILYLEPNLNVQEPSVVVPILHGTLEAGVTLWACAVRAGDPVSTLKDTAPVLHIALDGALSLSHGSIRNPLNFSLASL